jgi:hypothetical protein
MAMSGLVSDHQNGRWSPRCDLQHRGLFDRQRVGPGNYILAVVPILNSPHITVQNFSQRILKCTSLTELGDVA